MLTCAYCAGADDAVVQVGCCAAKCTVAAHRECAVRRRASPVYRKKHSQRPNHAGEVCPHPGCVAKFEPRLRRGTETGVAVVAAPKDDHVSGTPAVVPEDCCTFLRRDGFPCTRQAVADGACAQHLGQATLLRKLATAAPPPAERAVADACTQTDPWDAAAQVRAQTIVEVSRALQALALLE